jgi:hypothetical protein
LLEISFDAALFKCCRLNSRNNRKEQTQRSTKLFPGAKYLC